MRESQVLEILAVLTMGRFLVARVLPLVWNHAQDLWSLSLEQCGLYLHCIKQVGSHSLSHLSIYCLIKPLIEMKVAEFGNVYCLGHS